MTVTDPVCGAVIDAEDAASSEEYEGQTYFFCCEDCREEFEASPESYVEVRGD